MFNLLAGILIVTVPCTMKWSLVNKDTFAVFQEKGSEICVEFKDLRSQITKYESCFSFEEEVVPQTVFINNNTTYLFARSVLDNATIVLVNNNDKMRLFSYHPGLLRYNVFSESIFDYKDKTLSEYNIATFIPDIINYFEAKPSKLRQITQTMTDYQFVDNSTLIYLSGNKVFVDEREPLFLQDSDCLPLYLKLHHSIVLKLFCFFGICAFFLSVFAGAHLKLCWGKSNSKKSPLLRRSSRLQSLLKRNTCNKEMHNLNRKSESISIP